MKLGIAVFFIPCHNKGKTSREGLTDVEQEQNGLYTYDHRAKFEPEVIRLINTQKAAVEKA